MKKCAKCKTEKDENKFSPDRRRPDGLMGYCKECRNLDQKEYLKSPHAKKLKREGARRRYNENPIPHRNAVKSYRKRNLHLDKVNRQRGAPYRRKYQLKYISELKTGYIRGQLRRAGFTEIQIVENPQLIIIKSAIIKIKRHVRKNKDQQS